MSAGPRQRGATTLVTVMLLFFIMALVAGYASRNLVLEQRIARQQQAQAASQEAAEQGLQRALMWLNAGKLDQACRPSADASDPLADRLADRLLRFDETGRIGVPPQALGSPQPSDAPFTLLCDRRLDNEAWSCQCPRSLQPEALQADGQARESMLLRVRPQAADAGPGRVALSIRACAAASSDCRNAAGELPLAERVQALALLPALKMPPVSALVATGAVQLGSGMQLQHNHAAQGGVALQAGGGVSGSRDGVLGPAGAAADDALLEQIAGLAALDADALSRQHFGLPLAAQLQQPGLRQLVCERDCSRALAARVAAGHRLLWHEGDLQLDRDLVMGSAEQPLLLLVRGSLRLLGPQRLHGLVFVAGDLEWRNASGVRSLLSGALLVAGDVQAERGASVVYDAATLQRLRERSGSWLALPGGQWSRAW